MEGTNMTNRSQPYIGLTTETALVELLAVIHRELESFHSQRSERFRAWLTDAYHHRSAYSTLSWLTTLLVVLEAIIFVVCFALDCSERATAFFIPGLILLGILIFDICLVAWDSRQRHLEIAIKTEKMQDSIKELLHSCQSGSRWEDNCYPHLYMPQSPCISLQWAYRDGRIVNLPAQLLVEGDVIVIHPGHPAPGFCVCIDEGEELDLRRDEIFVPSHFQKENVNCVTFKKPTKPMKFLMQETPYALSLRICLEQSLSKPVTMFNKERHTIFSHYIQRIVIPIVLVVAVFVNGLDSIYLSPDNRHLFESLVVRPAVTILPLLPLSLPICWLFLNVLGMAYLLATADFCRSSAVDKQLDPFSEVEDETAPLPTLCVSWRHLGKYMKGLFYCTHGFLWRSTNLLQILGSVTALCCIDKKGILSWPNPTPEKVFFLSSRYNQNSNCEDNAYYSSASVVDQGADANPKKESLESKESNSETSKMKEHIYYPGSRVEVLDLTHNITNGYSVQFDDPNWKEYITNLKPLGLSILVNTCNPNAQEHYSRFSDHITCESLHNYAAVPVMNKRCLCELARQIGFMEGAANNYQLCSSQLLAAFRHVRPELIQKGPLAKSLNFPRLKTPFPNVSSAIIRDLHSGASQLFSQGTADLLLDCCSDYWDGKGIAILTESDRKRILDFYQRSSLTAHCMAFSYSALSQVPDERLASSYLELPPDCGHMFPTYRALHHIKPWKSICEEPCRLANHCLSTDSLFLQRQQETDDLEMFLQLLNNQIFIGMVTMQYQACPDFVQLIEVLEKACIRFVHFSKENELRSRVFSEKMGMESGWNCHISLLNEGYRSRSASSSKPPSQATTNLLPKMPSKEYFHGNKKELTRCHSAPTLINLENLVLAQNKELPPYVSTELTASTNSSPTDTAKETDPLTRHESASEDVILDRENYSYSSSHSHNTDHTVPVKFDMSNRAKLPKGIHNIRPHIENVDNVPLLVSLFTDCTAEATGEMIGIMQEYGEVVCCLGSAANVSNIPIFLKADVSIAIEPMYPRLCLHQANNKPSSQASDTLTPTELSAHLNSLPCALSFQRDDPVSLYHLIMEARHYTGGMQNCLLFMLCCCVSLSLLILLCNVFFLPLPLSVAHVLWLICVQVPLLSLSLMGNTADPHVMALATGKNLKVVNREMIVFFLCCYCIKFCPSVIITTMSFSFSIAHFCDKVQGPQGSCWIFVDPGNNSTEIEMDWPGSLAVSQNLAAFVTILYFVVISAGFVHRTHLLWKRNPLRNKCWTCVCILVLVLQVFFALVDLAIFTSSRILLHDVPFYVWVVSFTWPLVLLPLNAVIKMHEIKINVRQQKRARLEFGTKLGMNSPF